MAVAGVDSLLLNPRRSWLSAADYDESAGKLAKLFRNNIRKFKTTDQVVNAGPRG